MSVVTDEMHNAVLGAYMNRLMTEMRADSDGELNIPSRDEVEFILAAVAPIIAAQERERCALVADEEEAYHYKAIPVENLTSDDPIACPARQRTQVAGTIAAAIRALGDAT